MNLNTTNTFYDEKKKIWSGPKRPDLYGPDVTLGEAILETLKKNRGKVVQIMEPSGEKVTAAKLLRDSKILVNYLLKSGLKPGDVVGLYASNTTNVTSILIASLLCGTPWQTAFAELLKESVKDVFEITNPKIIFCDIENYETMKLTAKELNFHGKIITVNGILNGVESVEEILGNEDLFDEEETSYPCSKLNSDATAVILCSSGTTGKPKGVCCSHRAFLNSPINLNISKDDVLLSFSSYHWISGIFTFNLTLLYGGTRIIPTYPYSPEAFADIIEKYKVTFAFLATLQMAQLVQNIKDDTSARLSSLCTFLYGGSKVSEMIPKKLCEIFSPRVEHNIIYGLSEVAGIISETFRGKADKLRFDCEGKLMPNVEARIRDRTTSELLGPNAKGQLLVRTPYKWPGYYNAEEATKSNYIDGWIFTGDLASFDNDGFLTIYERQSDVFKTCNFQIYPSSLENVILQVPGVAEVCIFPIPDDLDENLIACAVVRSKNENGKSLTQSDILRKMKEQFSSSFHLKGGVFFVEELPRTVSGKVLRRKIFDVVKSLKN